MIWIKGESKWTFVTSATGGLGVEFVAVSGGAIYLQDPTGKPQTFHYGSLGAGLSAGLKLPKIGKVNLAIKGRSVGGAVAPAAFPNAGKIFITDAFRGTELKKSDLRGATVFVEAAAGVIAGIGGTVMLLGIDPLALASSLSNPIFMGFAISRAPAVLVAGGLGLGTQVGAGAAAFGGYLF